MNAFQLLARLGPVDLKSTRRDSMLLWIPLIPVVLALVLRLGLPALSGVLMEQLSFDLTEYYPLIMAGFVVSVPGLVGMIAGFLLLDERDDRVLDAQMVTPIPIDSYLSYKIMLPMVAGLVATVLTYPIVGLVPLPWITLILVSALGSLWAPIVALFLVGFAPDKVAGFALVKVMNALGALPNLTWFLPGNLQYLAGIFPVFWPMKIVWLVAAGQAATWQYAAGLAVGAFFIWLLRKRFLASLRQR